MTGDWHRYVLLVVGLIIHRLQLRCDRCVAVLQKLNVRVFHESLRDDAKGEYYYYLVTVSGAGPCNEGPLQSNPIQLVPCFSNRRTTTDRGSLRHYRRDPYGLLLSSSSSKNDDSID